jgi:hypothetical protein
MHCVQLGRRAGDDGDDGNVRLDLFQSVADRAEPGQIPLRKILARPDDGLRRRLDERDGGECRMFESFRSPLASASANADVQGVKGLHDGNQSGKRSPKARVECAELVTPESSAGCLRFKRLRPTVMLSKANHLFASPD